MERKEGSRVATEGEEAGEEEAEGVFTFIGSIGASNSTTWTVTSRSWHVATLLPRGAVEGSRLLAWNSSANGLAHCRPLRVSSLNIGGTSG